MSQPNEVHGLRRRWWSIKKRYLKWFYSYRHTGERVCPDFPDETFENHLQVYEFALQFAQGKRVLDVGCGTGYGTAFLLEHGAASVQGIDFSEEAVSYAQRKFGETGAQYALMDAQNIAFPEASFDMVFSSENLEHLPKPEACLAGIHRVLKEGGLLILGTPNTEASYDEKGRPLNNPYHIKEFSYEELETMLRPLFSTVIIFENTLTSSSEQGRANKADRERRGKVGVTDHQGKTIVRDGLSIDCSKLHNTHSFMVVARR